MGCKKIFLLFVLRWCWWHSTPIYPQLKWRDRILQVNCMDAFFFQCINLKTTMLCFQIKNVLIFFGPYPFLTNLSNVQQMTCLFLWNSYIFHVFLVDQPRTLSKARSQGWAPQSATVLQDTTPTCDLHFKITHRQIFSHGSSYSMQE